MSAGLARIGLAVALLTLGAGLGQVTAAGPAPAPVAAAAPVVGATVVCPRGPVTAGSVTAGSASGGSSRGGSLRTRSLPGAPAALPLTAAGGVLAGAPGPVVMAQGAVAGGLGVELVERVDEGAVRGLAALRCGAPATSSWFVGGSTVVGETAELVLVNADDEPAAVDVRVWSASGPVDPRPGRGLAVPAQGRVSVALDRLAPDRDLLAVHVSTSRGRVAAALRSSRSDGRTPRGVDWVPPTGEPAREVVVPGLPSGPGRRTVLVANPGEQDTRVRLELVTGDGTLAPLELDVAAGTTVAQEVSEALAETPAGVRVVSAGAPVLAAALVYDLQDGPVRELAWSGPVPPLVEPALLADVALSGPAEQTLLLTALPGGNGPAEDAVVDVVPVPVLRLDGTSSAGELPAPRQVVVPVGTTAALRLSTFLEPGARARLAFEVRVVRGRVHGARYLRERGPDGPLSAVLPVVGSRTTAPRPAVVADPLLASDQGAAADSAGGGSTSSGSRCSSRATWSTTTSCTRSARSLRSAARASSGRR